MVDAFRCPIKSRYFKFCICKREHQGTPLRRIWRFICWRDELMKFLVCNGRILSSPTNICYIPLQTVIWQTQFNISLKQCIYYIDDWTQISLMTGLGSIPRWNASLRFGAIRGNSWCLFLSFLFILSFLRCLFLFILSIFSGLFLFVLSKSCIFACRSAVFLQRIE